MLLTVRRETKVLIIVVISGVAVVEVPVGNGTVERGGILPKVAVTFPMIDSS